MQMAVKTKISDAAVKEEKPSRSKLDQRNTPAWRIARSIEKKGLTLAAIGKQLNCTHSTVSNWQNGVAEPQDLDTWKRLAKVVEAPPEYLAFGINYEPVIVMPPPETLGFALVPEVLFEGSPKDRKEAGKWGMPLDWLRAELGVTKYEELLVYKMPVQQAFYEYGDRVIVDTSAGARQPSPPGTFLYWDGYGPAVGIISVTPGIGKKRMARIAGGADGKNSVEVEADKLQIIGRVRGLWRKA